VLPINEKPISFDGLFYVILREPEANRKVLLKLSSYLTQPLNLKDASLSGHYRIKAH
jgi:hypothetical protein